MWPRLWLCISYNLKRNVVHIYTNVYETSIPKEVIVDTQKKKRDNEKEKKKSLLVYVYFSLFFFLMKQFNWSIVYSFFSVLASCGVTPSTAIIFTSTTYPQDLNFKKCRVLTQQKKNFSVFPFFNGTQKWILLCKFIFQLYVYIVYLN